jgi:hypothetical protein
MLLIAYAVGVFTGGAAVGYAIALRVLDSSSISVPTLAQSTPNAVQRSPSIGKRRACNCDTRVRRDLQPLTTLPCSPSTPSERGDIGATDETDPHPGEAGSIDDTMASLQVASGQHGMDIALDALENPAAAVRELAAQKLSEEFSDPRSGAALWREKVVLASAISYEEDADVRCSYSTLIIESQIMTNLRIWSID